VNAAAAGVSRARSAENAQRSLEPPKARLPPAPLTARRPQAESAAREAALRSFEQQLLGRKQGEALRAQLLESMDRERKSKELSNSAASNDACQALEMACTRQLDSLGRMAVPSMRQFSSSFGKCKAQFEVGRFCHGRARVLSSHGERPAERRIGALRRSTSGALRPHSVFLSCGRPHCSPATTSVRAFCTLPPHPAQAKCTGPARAASSERLSMAWERASKQFGSDYNGRLLTGLLVLSVGGILVFRFLLRARLLELASWLALGFLELYPM
jgi:hypothetical protein